MDARTDFLQTLLPDSEPTKWRDPSGTVALVPLPLHEDWYGHPSPMEAATHTRVAFLIRFGAGVLVEQRTVVQDGDIVYVSAVAGTVGEAAALAASAPPEDD